MGDMELDGFSDDDDKDKEKYIGKTKSKKSVPPPLVGKVQLLSPS